jgi:hypothetical protein
MVDSIEKGLSTRLQRAQHGSLESVECRVFDELQSPENTVQRRAEFVRYRSDEGSLLPAKNKLVGGEENKIAGYRWYI